MPATRLDLVAEPGRTLRVAADVLTSDGVTPDTGLTGWTGAMQIRATPDAATVLATATVTIDTATGIVTGTVGATTTATWTWDTAWYDMEITNNSDPAQADGLLYGVVRIRPTTTR